MDYILWIVQFQASSTIARQLQSPDISHVCSSYSFLHKFTRIKSEKHEHQALLCNERKIIKRQEKTCYMARGGIHFHYCILVIVGNLYMSSLGTFFFFFFLAPEPFFSQASCLFNHCLLSSKPRSVSLLPPQPPTPNCLLYGQCSYFRVVLTVGVKNEKLLPSSAYREEWATKVSWSHTPLRN